MVHDSARRSVPVQMLELRCSWPYPFIHIYHYTGGVRLIVTSAKLIANSFSVLETDSDFPCLDKPKSFVSITQKVLFPFHKMGPKINCNSQKLSTFPPLKIHF